MRRILALLALAGLALAAVSCGNKGKPIAKVSDQKITVAQFEEAFRVPGMAADSNEILSAKKRLLDQMVDQKLLAVAARDKGLDKDPKVQKDWESLEKQTLLGQLYRQEILDKAQPSESELKSFYEKMKTEIKARHILVKTEDEAKEVLKQLKNGAVFDELAMQKSLDPGSKTRGGDLGWFGWGRMVKGFQETAFGLKVGQLSKPVKTPFGYHIIKVDSIKQTELQPFEQMKERIKQQLMSIKPREMATEYVDKMKASAHVKLDKKVLAQLASKQPDTQGPVPLPTLDSSEARQKLVTYRGGTWTVQTFYDRVGKAFGGNANLKNEEILRQQVEAMLMEDLLMKRAKSMRLDRNPKVRTQLEKSYDDMLASAYYQAEIGPQINVTPEAIKDFYVKNRKQFYQPPKAMVSQITVKTKPEAEAIYKQLTGGADFGALAAEKSTDWTRSSRGALGELTQNDYRFPEAAKVAFTMPLNKVSRPFATKDGFAVIKVTSRTPGKQLTFEESRPGIEQNMMQAQEQVLYEKLMEELKNKYPVTIDEELLKKSGNQKPLTENK